MPDAPPAAERPLIPLWLALVGALVGGAVLDAAFPDIGWWPLALIGVAFSLVGLIGRSAWGAVAVGAVFGASFYFIHISWITRYLGPVPWFGLAGIETIFFAAASDAATRPPPVSCSTRARSAKTAAHGSPSCATARTAS